MMVLTAHMDDDDEQEAKADPRTIAQGNRELRTLSRTMFAAYLAVGAGLVGAAIGWAIDRAASTSPRWTLIVAGVALAGGIFNLVTEVRK